MATAARVTDVLLNSSEMFKSQTLGTQTQGAVVLWGTVNGSIGRFLE